MTGRGRIADQIWEAHRASRHRRADQARLARPVAIVDRLLGALEEVNLAERATVPVSLRGVLAPLLESLRAWLPPDLLAIHGPLLRLETPVLDLMDHLYDLQEELLARREMARGAVEPPSVA